MSFMQQYVLHQISVRATILRLVNPSLSHAQARKIAAKEIGETQRQQQGPQPKQPKQPKHKPRHSGSSIQAMLVDRFMRAFDAFERMQPTQQPDSSSPSQHSPSTSPVEAATSPEPASRSTEAGSPPQPSLLARVLDAVRPFEPTSPTSLPSLDKPYDEKELFVRNSSAVLIPDEEFAPAYQESIATRNWKASITNNVVHFDERRGGPKPKSRYIG
jgi:hypothetical protein